MVPKRENGQAANRRLTRSIHNVGFIISFIIIYLSTHTLHVHAGAIRKLIVVYSHVQEIILSLRPVS